MRRDRGAVPLQGVLMGDREWLCDRRRRRKAAPPSWGVGGQGFGFSGGMNWRQLPLPDLPIVVISSTTAESNAGDGIKRRHRNRPRPTIAKRPHDRPDRGVGVGAATREPRTAQLTIDPHRALMSGGRLSSTVSSIPPMAPKASPHPPPNPTGGGSSNNQSGSGRSTRSIACHR